MKKLISSDIERYLFLKNKKINDISIFKYIMTVFSPRMIPVLFLRISTSSIPIIDKLFSLLNVIIFGVEVNSQCKVGEGIFLPHTVGTVIGAKKIGINCIIFQGVTIGAKVLDFSNNSGKRPIIGNNVIIGAGAKVLGDIIIGDNVTIGANTVVTSSIDENKTVVGGNNRMIRV